jgi:hypothetical protein
VLQLHLITLNDTLGRTALDNTSPASFHNIRKVKDISLSICQCVFFLLSVKCAFV